MLVCVQARPSRVARAPRGMRDRLHARHFQHMVASRAAGLQLLQLWLVMGSGTGTPAGYTKQPGDCGFPVCQTVSGVPGISPVPPTTLETVAQACNNTAHCMGFNSNGWLKRCLPPRCPAATKGMEPRAPCDLYIKIGPPHDGPPVPPPPPPPPPPDTPIPDVEDPIYPVEEFAQAAAANIPSVVSIDTESCELRVGEQTRHVAVGDQAFGGWTVLAVLNAQTPRPALVAMQRQWLRWSLVAFASTDGATQYDIQLRKPLGDLSFIRTAPYDQLVLDGHSTAYFTRVVTDPDDYIAKRIVAESTHGEASYLKAAKFLPPIVDYAVIGDSEAPIVAVATMDGKLQRSDGGDQSFPAGNPGTPQTQTPSRLSVAPSYSSGGCEYTAESKHSSVHVCAADNCHNHATLAEAKQACDADPTCGGINAGPYGEGPVCCYTTRKGTGFISTWPCPGSTTDLNSSGWLVANAGKGSCRNYTGGYVPPPPPPPPPPPCYSSLECRQGGTKFDFVRRSYCQLPQPAQGGSPSHGSRAPAGQCAGGGGTVFDAMELLQIPPTNFSDMVTGMLGGYLRVAAVGAFDRDTRRGFEMMALGPLAADNDTILVALRNTTISEAADLHDRDSPRSEIAATYDYYNVSLDRRHPPNSTLVAPSLFWSAVVDHAVKWQRIFAPGMKVTLPYSERRQVDMAKGVLVATSTVFFGDRPNYGTDVYWMGGPPAAAMMDTSGIPDSLPLTSLSMDTALLQWGVFDSALSKVGFYFDTFIFPNGTADMGHWKDIWKDAGGGGYNCTYPDGLSDMGRLLELFSDTVRLSRNTEWLTAHLPAAIRIGKYLLHARHEAVERFPASDPRYGLIYGPAEHDTCDMGMGGSAKVVDGQYMLFYFSVSMQSWRGMLELANLMLDFPSAAWGANVTLAEELLAEAERFKVDIDNALRHSVVLDNATGATLFVPAAVTPGKNNATPYDHMTQDTVASYSNFSTTALSKMPTGTANRYYSEMLSSGFMDNVTSVALMNFRESHGGTLSGMTRYTDHLDDMPAIGYARSSLSHDRIQQFLLLLYGHTANYQGRGSFISNEQQSLYQDPNNPSWRASMGEIQASFCTPSQTLVASMTAMQLLHYERANATIWIARGAPRRWYDKNATTNLDFVWSPPNQLFGVDNGPTRWGNVSFHVGAQQADGVTDVHIVVDFHAPVGAVEHRPTVQVRIRDPTGQKRLSSATTVPGSTNISSEETGLTKHEITSEDKTKIGAGCDVVAVASDKELVTIAPVQGGRAIDCTVRAKFDG